MRVFLTGSTGHIGLAVVYELMRSGHEVTGLVRAESKVDDLIQFNATPFPGDLLEPESYREEAAKHDAMIHVAFVYGEKAATADKMAIETLLAAAKSTNKPRQVIYTSGTHVLGDTGKIPAAENAPTGNPAEIVRWRPAHEKMVLQASTGGLATVVIRPGMVYGGSGSLTAKLFETAEQEKAAHLIGTGKNWWSMVYREDLARLYRLAVEKHARGIFHGVDGKPVQAIEAAKVASQVAGAGGKVKLLPVEQARAELGALADALCMNQIIISGRAGELGWTPQHKSFPESAYAAYQEWKTNMA